MSLRRVPGLSLHDSLFQGFQLLPAVVVLVAPPDSAWLWYKMPSLAQMNSVLMSIPIWAKMCGAARSM
eukprot:5543109-Amphidinium_carterae.1